MAGSSTGKQLLPIQSDHHFCHNNDWNREPTRVVFLFFQTSKYLIYVAIRINERTILSTLNKPNPVFYIVHQHSTRKSHKWIDKYSYVQYFHTYSRFRTLKCHLKTAYISLLKLSCQKFDVLRTRRPDI